MTGQDIFVSVVGGILTLGLALGALVREPPGIIDEDLGAIDQPSARHLVWFLDPSEVLSNVEWRTIQNEISAQSRTLQVGDRLSIVVLAPERADSHVFHSLFSKCRPKDGSMAHPWYENPDMLDTQYQEQFEQPLQEAIQKIGQLAQVKTSPLLEAFYRIATMKSFTAADERQLFIVSDLLEFSEIANHYKNPYRFADVQDHPFVTKKLDGKPLLHQCDVEVFLRPNKKLHTSQHTQFWEKYWAAVGVQRVVTKRL